MPECAQWIGWLEVSRVRVHIFACIRAAPLVPRAHTTTTRLPPPRYLAPLVLAARRTLNPSLGLCCCALVCDVKCNASKRLCVGAS
jgi:hypothetical protein